MIISAENKAYPILGYSLKRKFDRETLTDDENNILKKYAREIEIVRYDARIPEKALAAWQNLQGYIAEILATPYDGVTNMPLCRKMNGKILRCLTVPAARS